MVVRNKPAAPANRTRTKPASVTPIKPEVPAAPVKRGRPSNAQRAARAERETESAKVSAKLPTKSKAPAPKVEPVAPKRPRKPKPTEPGTENSQIANRPVTYLHHQIASYIQATTGLTYTAEAINHILRLNSEYRRSPEYAAFKESGGSTAFRAETVRLAKIAKIKAKLAELEGGDVEADVTAVLPIDVEPEEVEDETEEVEEDDDDSEDEESEEDSDDEEDDDESEESDESDEDDDWSDDDDDADSEDGGDEF